MNQPTSPEPEVAPTLAEFNELLAVAREALKTTRIADQASDEAARRARLASTTALEASSAVVRASRLLIEQGVDL